MRVRYLYNDMVAGIPGQELLEVKIASANVKPFHCFGKVPVEPHAASDDLDKADVVIVCDMYTSIYDVPTGRYPREVAWLKRLNRDGALIWSVCSGAQIGRASCRERECQYV